MRRLLTILTSTILLGSLQFTNAVAQSYSTQGRDFWLMHLQNAAPSTGLCYLILTNENEFNVTVNIEQYYSEVTFFTQTIEVPAMRSIYVAGGVAFYCQHVTSTNDISVYAFNWTTNPASGDITTIFPTQSLRSHYMIQTYEDNVGEVDITSEIGIIAVEDSTYVTVATPGGDTMCFTLHAGESRIFCKIEPGPNFVVRSPDYIVQGRMTGTTVEAANGKKLAVFQGNQAVALDGTIYTSHLYEQALPTDYWGRTFIVAPIIECTDDHAIIKITTLEDSCRVSVNDTFAATINAGESHVIRRRNACKITTTKPATTCLYSIGYCQSIERLWGTPSAVIIPPVEQGIVHVNTPGNNSPANDFVCITTKTCNVSNILFDGHLMDTAFHNIDNTYSYAHIFIGYDTNIHTLNCLGGIFQAWFYGMGDHLLPQGYAHSAGIAMIDTNSEMSTDDSVLLLEDIHLCNGDTTWVDLQSYTNFGDVLWFLDDVQLDSTAIRLSLHFDSVGTHTLRALLHGDCCQEWCQILQITIYVHPTYSEMSTDDSVLLLEDIHLCNGDTTWVDLQSYTNFGDVLWFLDDVQLDSTAIRLSLHFDSVGTHTLRALLHGDCCQEWCQILQTTIYVHPTYFMEKEELFCLGSAFHWCDTTIYDEGIYHTSYNTLDGCDSLLVLHLIDKYTPHYGMVHEVNCYSHTYRLMVDKQDTIVWDSMWWSAAPDDPMLHGYEHDTTVDVSPSRSTTYTLHIETPCPVDSSIRLEPIVWPVARMKVLPETVMLSERNTFDAYDLSQQATGRRWDVDGVTQTECGPHLHYTLNGQMDSVLVVLTAYNDYCIDTANAVVKVLATDIYAPNVFTPEADLNNRFSIITLRPIEGELSIYNREGLLVFRTDDLTTGWNGLGCPQGAYVWHLRYRFDFETVPTSHTAVGIVTLLR